RKLGSVTETYEYDANGNLCRQNTERHFTWDHADRLTTYANRPAGAAQASVEARYLSAADGKRVKKFVLRNGLASNSCVYIDGIFEHFNDQASGQHTDYLHVIDNMQRIALLRRGDAGKDAGPPVQFHLGDHLGSSSIVI